MSPEFKNKLFKLYPKYDKATGPYTREDGRKHIVLNNSSLSKGDISKLRTVSWPKAIMEVYLGRLLDGLTETVDHIDEDFTNDNFDNLQVLSRGNNILKSFSLNPERFAEYLKFNCVECNSEFLLLARQYRGNQLSQKSAGPFCSRYCSGRYSKKVQIEINKFNARVAQLAGGN